MGALRHLRKRDNWKGKAPLLPALDRPVEKSHFLGKGNKVIGKLPRPREGG